MKTECPHCNTIFAITEQQLVSADGMVRCGMCNEVFTAVVQDDLFEHPAEPPACDDSADEETQALHDYALTTDEVVADEPVETTSPEPESTPAPTDYVDDSDQDSYDPLFETTDKDIIPDHIRHQVQGRTSLLAGILWGLGIIVLLSGLVIQYAWYDRQTLLSLPQVKPLLAQVCERVDCSHLALRDPSKIEMTRRNIYTHPTVEKALMIAVTMVNQADFAQAYPDIKIAFSDVVGTVIASRQFTPDEYLETGQNRPLAPDVPVSFTLEVQDPGKQALTYEFDFL